MTTLRTSPLATGPVGQLTAWTARSMLPTAPFDFGYAYRYTAANAWPAGLSIDPDSGLVSAAAIIPAGTYHLGVRATNRRNASLSSTFAVDLVSDGAIVHRVYDPHSATFGTPNGNDWTQVFQRINAAILADQEQPGMDGNIWAEIPLRGGVRYDYSDNRWPCGAQFLEVYQSDAFPGPRPQLRCTYNWTTQGGYDIQAAPIQAGGGSVFDFFASSPASKTWAALIDSAKPGDVAVTLKTAADAARCLRVGRWHMILSYDQQAGGGPPNSRYYDWVKITGINGSIVSLDRPLRHRHSDTYWETFPQDQISFGRARIIPMDVGGAGGVEATGTKTKVRATQRGVWTRIEFVTNPNHPAQMGIGTFCYEDGIDIHFIDCVLPYAVPSITKHVTYSACTIPQRMEMDKLTETLVVDGCQIGGEGIGSSTGVELWLVRDTILPQCQSSPRQMRVIRSTFDIQKATNIGPLTDSSCLVFPGIPGPIHVIELEGTTFAAQNGPAYNPGTIYPKRDVTVWSATLGTDCSWSTNRLVVPRSSAQFVNLLGYVFEGMIVYAGGTAQSPTAWGYVTNLTSPGDGSAQWIDITWVKGAKPTSGQLSFCRNHRVSIDDGCARGNSWTRWYPEGSFFKSRVPSTWGATYDFPAGYPFTGY